MTKPYSGGTVNAGEQLLPSLGQAIAASLQKLQQAKTGKVLVAYFDGREGKEVAESTLSRWIGDPGRFPAIFLPILAELDPDFRRQLVGSLLAADVIHERVVSRLSPKSADEYRRAAEAVVIEEIGPGRWARR